MRRSKKEIKEGLIKTLLENGYNIDSEVVFSKDFKGNVSSTFWLFTDHVQANVVRTEKIGIGERHTYLWHDSDSYTKWDMEKVLETIENTLKQAKPL